MTLVAFTDSANTFLRALVYLHLFLGREICLHENKNNDVNIYIASKLWNKVFMIVCVITAIRQLDYLLLYPVSLVPS